MEEPQIILRNAKASNEDGLVFAKYVDIASDNFFQFLLGPRFKEIIAEAFLQTGHDMSYQYVMFAEKESEIVGMYLGYTAEEHHSASKEPLIKAAGPRNFRMKIINTIFAPLMRISDNIPKGDFYLQFIAVDESVLGGGVGAILMDSFEDRARACKSKRISLDVTASNRVALEFYKHRGMVVESQWPKRIPLPGLKFYRMIKSL